ncbi:hypothetical protein ACA910_013363 [Epithemia clementina (nom. ined.)]
MSFAFDFSIDVQDAAGPENDNDNDNHHLNTHRREQQQQQQHQPHRSLREPLVWMDASTLQELLQQQSDRELTCREINLLQQRHPAQEQSEEEDEQEEAMHHSIDSSREGGGSRGTSSSSSSSKNILRWVVDVEEEEEEEVESNQILSAERTCSSSRVVKPGVYEGGLQVWECSLDLVRYLHHSLSSTASSSSCLAQEEEAEKDVQFLQSLFSSSLFAGGGGFEAIQGSHTTGNPAQATDSSSIAMVIGDDDNNNNNYNGTVPERRINSRPKILELGCGHALPSLYLLRHWCLSGPVVLPVSSSTVTTTTPPPRPMTTTTTRMPQFYLCDYNAHVIPTVTVPNLVLNAMNALLHESVVATTTTTTTQPTMQQPPPRNRVHQPTSSIEEIAQLLSQIVHCGTGDWLGLLSLAEQQAEVVEMADDNGQSCDSANQPKNRDDAVLGTSTYGDSFDLILAAETLYTPESAQETCQLIAHLLKPETGVAFVATKRYYFGVGGGSEAFLQAAAATTRTTNSGANEELQVDIVQVYDNGVSNIRELLRVRRVLCHG